MLRIIIPTLGESPYLSATLESVKSITVPFEVVLVCPKNVFGRISCNYPEHAVVAEQISSGVYSALNTGLSLSTNNQPWTFFTYINDDDCLGSEFGAYASEVIEYKGMLDIAYGIVHSIDENGNRLFKFPVSKSQKSFERLWRRGLTPMYQQGMLVRRTLHNMLGSFDSDFKYAGDCDYICRADLIRATFRFWDYHVGDFRFRFGQLSSEADAFRKEKEKAINTHCLGEENWLKSVLELLKYRLTNFRTYLEKFSSGNFRRTETLFKGKK